MSVMLTRPAVGDELALVALAFDDASRCDVGSFRAAPPGQRRWMRLVDTPEHDAWLIAWGAGSVLGLHDHEGSEGALFVVRGVLVERYHDGTSEPITRVIAARDTVNVPRTRVHAVHNPFRVEAVSVHVYSPPLPARVATP